MRQAAANAAASAVVQREVKAVIRSKRRGWPRARDIDEAQSALHPSNTVTRSDHPERVVGGLQAVYYPRTVRPRLTGLFLVAVVSGTLAALLGNATVGKAGSSTLVSARPPVTIGRCPIPAQYRQAFEAASHDTRLPLAMLSAVAQVESQFVETARSPAGAHGLLQVMPDTAKDFDLDPYQPKENVLAGARYLRTLLDHFKSTDLALAAYNAGPDAVEKAGGAPSPGVRQYVDDVTRIWRSINGCR